MMRFLGGLLSLSLIASAPVWSQDLAIMHARVYASPESQPIDDATVLVRGGKIASVGHRVAVPRGIEQLDCRGCVVMAGFWNTHVHFVEPKWADAAHLPAAQLTKQLQEMLTHSGFTTVVDTASDPAVTVAIRRRIEADEVDGPGIYTAGIPLYPAHHLPFYLKYLPPELGGPRSQPETPEQAAASVRENIAAGADILKLFTGSIISPGEVFPMEAPIVKAAADEAHLHHQLVFAHATNLVGTRVAIENGVDVIAHAPEITDGIDDTMLHNLVARHVSIIPTLALFSKDGNIADIRSVLLHFHRMGGVLMFGTDTGFLTDYDMGEDYRQLGLAGFNFREVLTMLTTAPAERFGVAKSKGRVAPGMDADLTVLSVDPASGDPAAFARVKYTFRRGRRIFSAE